MTGPRISSTSLETLKQILGMATKPDATSTPDFKASFDDLMRQLTGGGTVSNRYEGPPLAIPISQSAIPEYIGGPGGVPKVVGKVGEGLKKVLGVSGKKPLMQAAKDVPVYDTPAFKNWFGDSKIVDEVGKPRVAYHATPHDFDTFKVGGTVDDKSLYQSGPAIWAGFDRDTYRAAHNVGGFIGPNGAAVYKPGTNVMPLHAKVENPLIVTPQNYGSIKDELGLSGAFPTGLSHQDVAKLKERGHDGILTRLWGPAEEEVVVFDNTQLKSAIGNRGTFDPKDPRITYGILSALGLGAATKKKKANETR